jgi:hypothetical protein
MELSLLLMVASLLPDEYVGKCVMPIEGFANQVQDLQVGRSNIVIKSAIDSAGFCLKSEEACDGSSWTARHTEVYPDYTSRPVANSTVLLETPMVFESPDECDSFISE